MKEFLIIATAAVVLFGAYSVFVYNPSRGYYELVNEEFKETVLFTAQMMPFICEPENETFIRVSGNYSRFDDGVNSESEREFLISKEEEIIDFINNLKYYNSHQEELVYRLREAAEITNSDTLERLEELSEVFFEELGPEKLGDWIKDDIGTEHLSRIKSFKFVLLTGPTNEKFLLDDFNYLYDAYIKVASENGIFSDEVIDDCLFRYREIFRDLLEENG